SSGPAGSAGEVTRAADGNLTPPIRIPFTPLVIVGSPLNIALLTAVGAIPLLLALWVFLVGRTWVEGRRRRDADLRLAVAGEIGVDSDELNSMGSPALSKLREQVTFDELTGTLRRGAGIAAVQREIARAQRLNETLAVAFIDVDGLKGVNDSRGHTAGDAILKGVATLLQERLRGQDLVFRFGGDEFVCVMPETGVPLAHETLSGLQAEAREKGLNFSFGAADLEPGDDSVSLLGRADGQLYQAKQDGVSARPLPVRPRRPTVLS
ncbi:MAG: GGDEF domain-containing protein, partial [Candidatus Dormibacteraeota bacterium]|nr:GGDEF domain-containing protein [Candidatus Dormibacteraeota bacterium]